MNRKRSLFAASTVLTALAGSALGGQQVPASIASHNELALQEIAGTMIHSLTPA